MTALLIAILIVTAGAIAGFAMIVVGIRRDDKAMSRGAASPVCSARIARRVTGLRVWKDDGPSSRTAQTSALRPVPGAATAPLQRCAAR
ncbi:hypothetical protein TBS_18550 [Thermobispora bispora]